MSAESRKEPTVNEAYLMRLLNFRSLRELWQFLDTPEDFEALSHMEPPDDFYEEITRAEEESQMVDDLEGLYALPSPPLGGPA